MDTFCESPTIAFGADFGRYGLTGGGQINRTTAYGNLEADALQSTSKLARRTLRTDSVEEVGSGFFVDSSVADDLPDDCGDPMSDSHARLLFASPSCDPEEQALQEGAIGMCGCPGTLNQDPTQIAISLSGSAGKALSRALCIAGTQSCPTRQMCRIGKPGHIRPGLGDDRLRHHDVHAGDGIQSADQVA